VEEIIDVYIVADQGNLTFETNSDAIRLNHAGNFLNNNFIAPISGSVGNER